MLTLAVAGCAILDSEELRSELALRFVNNSPGGQLPLFQFSVEGPSEIRQLTVDDFEEGTPVRFDAGPFKTGSVGSIIVSCSVPVSGSNTDATIETTLRLRSDWRNIVECSAGTENPIGFCFGCSGAKSIPLNPDDNTAGDSLFLVWSGNSISNPVIF